MKFKLIAVHGGAGYHHKSSTAETEIKRCLKLACKRSWAMLDRDKCALDAVQQAIVVLEDDPCLNAGFGSNLTFQGTVECDASIMEGRTADFGSVGAISGVKNPIQAAAAVLQHTRQPDPLGRIRPILLVSHGARAFAEERHVPCVLPEELIAPRSEGEWVMWKEQYETAANNPSPLSVTSQGLSDRQDTVGAISWDASGGLAAGVSSGGLLLKLPGRIGEAAIFGAGCWAQQNHNTTVERGVACSLSGSGEYITRMTLAKTIGEAIMQDPDPDIHEILTTTLGDFYAICRSRGEQEPSAGVLLVVQEPNDSDKTIARLWCAFTTESMAIAYASTLHPKPKVMILRRGSEPFQKDRPSIFITSLPLDG